MDLACLWRKCSWLCARLVRHSEASLLRQKRIYQVVVPKPTSALGWRTRPRVQHALHRHLHYRDVSYTNHEYEPAVPYLPPMTLYMASGTWYEVVVFSTLCHAHVDRSSTRSGCEKLLQDPSLEN